MALNEQQKKFAEYYFQGGKAVWAYKKAYEVDGKKVKYNSAATTASSLLKKAEVQEYIQNLRDEQVSLSSISEEEIVRQWITIMTDMSYSPKDRLRASEMIAKYKGMFIERVQQEVMTTIEVGFAEDEEEWLRSFQKTGMYKTPAFYAREMSWNGSLKPLHKRWIKAIPLYAG